MSHGGCSSLIIINLLVVADDLLGLIQVVVLGIFNPWLLKVMLIFDLDGLRLFSGSQILFILWILYRLF